MNDTIKKILAPLASLRVTLVLLLLSMLLVLAGTTAQREMGIQDVQHEFFHSWLAWIQLHYFQPTPGLGHVHSPGVPPATGWLGKTWEHYTDNQGYIRGYFPLPGGYSLMAAILVNLLAAHAIRFKLRAKRIGIILIHAGLIMLVIGEILTSVFAVESQMRLDTKGPYQSTNYAEDIRFAEMAIVDHSPGDHDDVTVISQTRLKEAAGGPPIRDLKLPFDIQVIRWYENSELRGPNQTGGDIERLANAGSAASLGIVNRPKVSGAGADASRTDIPSAFITLTRNGKSLGTYLVSLTFDRSYYDLADFRNQHVDVDGKSYTIDLRFPRYYKPYKITLKNFTHEIIPGTDMAKNFASTIQLVEGPNVNREVKIWMNHPLRYGFHHEGLLQFLTLWSGSGSDTFYQQSFANNDNTTVLQVVHNPASAWPYLACFIGALGLVVHFGTTLVGFLRRKLAPKGRIPSRPGDRSDRYTLKPEPAWKTLGIPLVVISIAFVAVVAQLFNHVPTEPYDFNGFGRIPIFSDGRPQPLDSVARNSLSVISGGHTVFKDKDGKEHPAIEWLADVMTRSHNWADDKVIRIDHPQVKDMFGLKEEEKLFSWNDLKFEDPQVRNKLDEQWELAGNVAEKQRDSFQNQIIELHNHMGVYFRLMQPEAIQFQLELMGNAEKLKKDISAIHDALDAASPTLFADIDSGKADRKELRKALARLDRGKLTPEQNAELDKRGLLDGLRQMGEEGQLLLIPPDKNSAKWQPIMSVIDTSDAIPETATSLLRILKAYADGRAQDFNADLAGYQSRMQSLPDMPTVAYEVAFNRIAPFYISMVLYVFIFLLAFLSWLVWTKPLLRSGYGLLILALVIHTVGVVSRIYISGRPPVTNLYSASVFIGWAIVVFSVVMEAIFRNGIALVAGSVAGFLSLLVAAGFAVGEGDTMRQLQAVLDTNIWLSTHVVCVTMGYMATVLSGILATIFVLMGLFNRSFRGENAKDVTRMIYGITCFAMLFSFVGTILGGIWADQSWGRFWGWDPKENGAVLVVLWNALILHARWSGIVRERGVAALAILGNIVVGWSFVGTNLLGIGLHSYGFMSGAQLAVLAWSGLNLALASICLIPKKHWAMYAAPDTVVSSEPYRAGSRAGK